MAQAQATCPHVREIRDVTPSFDLPPPCFQAESIKRTRDIVAGTVLGRVEVEQVA